MTRSLSLPLACSSITQLVLPGRRLSRCCSGRRYRLDEHACLLQPAKEMRLRVLDFGVDKYGLNAYIFDFTNDSSGQL